MMSNATDPASFLQCKAPFTLRTLPYFDTCTWTHGDIRRARFVRHVASVTVCVNAAIEINVLDYSVAILSVNGV